MNDHIANLAVAAISSMILIMFIGLILYLFAQKSPGMALCLIGIFLAIASAVQSSISGVALHQNLGQMTFATASGSTPMHKIAVILVLAGVGMIFLSRSSATSSTMKPTESSDVP